MTDLEGRVAELETRVAFQDMAIQELNEALTRQHLDLSAMGETLERIRERLREILRALPEADSRDPPPPHY